MSEQPQEFNGRIKAGKDWREIVAMTGDLPPMPQVASKAVKLVEDPETTAVILTKVLEQDAALTTRVLKIANSAMFSRQREITTLQQAIMVIGFKSLKGIVMAATLRQIFKGDGALEKLVWESSTATAMAATLIAKQLKKKYAEEIFLLGLLHNLGHLIFLAQPELAKEFKRVVTLTGTGIDFINAEAEIFGFSHTLLGALVVKKWNFPEETCKVILHYKDPINPPLAPLSQEEKSAVICASELLVRVSKIGTPENYPDQQPQLAGTLQALGVPAEGVQETITELITKLQEQVQNEQAVYA